MKKQNKNSIQEWLPFERILDNGIIKLKNQKYIKIISVNPINYNLKTELEKNAVLASYKMFLKTCNFDIQFIIQSNKEDYHQYFAYLEEQSKKESKFIQNLQQEYSRYVKELSSNIQSSSKKFFLVIETSALTTRQEDNDTIALEELNEKYHKIKECLARCGNEVSDYSSKLQVLQIIQSCINKKEFYQ